MKTKMNPGPSYPFTTKAQVKARLMGDMDYVKDCLAILADRTLSRSGAKKYGFSRSHEKVGLDLATKGESWSPEEQGRARSLTLSYLDQLAAHFRAAEIASNPALAEVAKIFSAA